MNQAEEADNCGCKCHTIQSGGPERYHSLCDHCGMPENDACECDCGCHHNDHSTTCRKPGTYLAPYDRFACSECLMFCDG